MNQKSKRVTIYDIANELVMSASYVSRALNNHPLVSPETRYRVKKKALELNYKHNSYAANLRQGSSKTIGVLVPHINQSFFSGVIAGIAEVCFQHSHGLVICQSHESFEQECLAVENLVQQNVSCILISVSAETLSFGHLESVSQHNIDLIQFDRCIDKLDSHKVMNNNLETSFNIVNTLIEQGYKKIAFLGGPEHLAVFKDRKDGYLKALENAGISIPYNFVVDNVLSKDKAAEAAIGLLSKKERPDAFVTVSDHQSLAVLQAAKSLAIKVPEQLGIFGFANEIFTELIEPSLSSVDQKSKEMGAHAANLYFDKILQRQDKNSPISFREEIIKTEIIVRDSSIRVNGRVRQSR
jgi:LacI family transcriptional regulator